ncbi:MAG TPA: hypothetical protein PKI01_03125 [Bacteroidales bacterium]|nr:hypothetical protein [Bacteroidales bacterium]
MADLVLNKKPEEKNWVNVEILTDGRIDRYTGSDNYSYAKCPCTLTYDLTSGTKNLESKKIKFIRFLLWDGLGDQVSTDRDDRKYRYSLSFSRDGRVFEEIYHTSERGFNGWQIIEFTEPFSTKLIQLTILSNTANDQAHLIEFSVFNDLVIPEITFHNKEIINYVFIDPRKTKEGLREDLIKTIDEKLQGTINDYLTEIEKFRQTAKQLNIEQENRIKETTTQSGKFKEGLKKLELIKTGLHFHDEAIENNLNAKKWLIASIVVLFVFIITIFILFYTNLISVDTEVADEEYNHIFKLVKNLLLRILLISLNFYALVFCIKNYKSKKHNYVINTHKALALSTAVELMSNADLSKDQILTQVTQAIFSHQSTGYDDKEGEPNPSIITSVIENIPKGK